MDDDVATKARRIMPVVGKELLDATTSKQLDSSGALEAFLAPHIGYEAAVDPRTQALVRERVEPTLAYLELMSNARLDVDETGTLTGYAAVVRDDVALDLDATPLLTTRTGSGRTWLLVEQPSRSEQTLVNEHAADVLRDVKSIDSTRVVLTEAMSSGRRRLYHVVVDGNDRASAAELVRAVRAAGAMTLHEAMRSPQYKACLLASEAARERVARAVVERFALVATTGTVYSVPTHFIVDTNKYSNVARGPEAGGARSYSLVFSDTFNLDTTRHGALVFRGPLAGYEWLRGPDRQDPITQGVSSSWNNATSRRLFSVFPTDTGRFEPTSGRQVDEHAGASAELAVIARERVRSFGSIDDVNPLVGEAYHATSDAEWQRVATLLGAVESAGVKRLAMDAIVAVVPGVQTKGLSLARVAALTAPSSVTRVPVGRTVLLEAMGARWETLTLSKTMRVAEVFADEHDDHFVVDKAIVAALAAE